MQILSPTMLRKYGSLLLLLYISSYCTFLIYRSLDFSNAVFLTTWFWYFQIFRNFIKFQKRIKDYLAWVTRPLSAKCPVTNINEKPPVADVEIKSSLSLIRKGLFSLRGGDGKDTKTLFHKNVSNIQNDHYHHHFTKTLWSDLWKKILVWSVHRIWCWQWGRIWSIWTSLCWSSIVIRFRLNQIWLHYQI